MKRIGMILVIMLFAAIPASAQENTVGLTLGAAEFLEDSLSIDFSSDVQEIWYSRELEAGTVFRLKLGQADFEVEEEDSDLPPGDYEVEYAAALIEYRFHEIYGSTTIYLGPGAYRQNVGAGDETNFGLNAGVTADFPMTRQIGVILEAGYHWVNFDEEYQFVTIGGGFRFSF
ncbi:MAG: hypothetical protein R3338_01750 [Thermoanaerobaculia bacterium]|nr:hypothetical protein [Thermoanaerobaculia bacterium]